MDVISSSMFCIICLYIVNQCERYTVNVCQTTRLCTQAPINSTSQTTIQKWISWPQAKPKPTNGYFPDGSFSFEFHQQPREYIPKKLDVSTRFFFSYLLLRYLCLAILKLRPSNHICHTNLHQIRVRHTQIRDSPPAIFSQESIEVVYYELLDEPGLFSRPNVPVTEKINDAGLFGLSDKRQLSL